MKSSAHATIDPVLHENKILSITLYALAVLSVACGITVLGISAWRNQPVAVLAAAIETYLFLPLWRFVQKLRSEKMMVRLLEIGLKNAQTTSRGDHPHAFEKQLRKDGNR